MPRPEAPITIREDVRAKLDEVESLANGLSALMRNFAIAVLSLCDILRLADASSFMQEVEQLRAEVARLSARLEQSSSTITTVRSADGRDTEDHTTTG